MGVDVERVGDSGDRVGERVPRKMYVDQRALVKRMRELRRGAGSEPPKWLVPPVGPGEMRAHYRGLRKREDRTRFIALLNTIYTARRIHELLPEVSEHKVRRYAAKHWDLIAAMENRPVALVNKLAELRMLQLLATMDPEKVSQDRKAQSVRHLADALESQNTIARENLRAADDSDSTGALMRRIISRMREVEGQVTKESPRLGAINVTLEAQRISDESLALVEERATKDGDGGDEKQKTAGA